MKFKLIVDRFTHTQELFYGSAEEVILAAISYQEELTCMPGSFIEMWLDDVGTIFVCGEDKKFKELELN